MTAAPELRARLGLSLALLLAPAALAAQMEPAGRDQLVWHWFGSCSSPDSLVLDVRLDDQPLYGSTFPICRLRIGDIRPEPQERVLKFRFVAEPRRFGRRYQGEGAATIECDIWEAGRQSTGVVLGFSFVSGGQVLLNAHHPAPAGAPSRSERVRGLVITTRPLARPQQAAPRTRAARPSGAPSPTPDRDARAP